MKIQNYPFGLISLLVLFLLSVAAHAETPSEKLTGIRIMLDQRVPMRDGVELSADVFLPEKEGKYPVILIRNPYNKSVRRAGLPYDFITYFAQRGYVTIGQDVRGRGDSDGNFGYYHADIEDGYDSVEWAAAQPWSNGKIGMMGISYLGTVQWQAAKVVPPHLVCLASTAAAGDFMDEIGYVGGAFGAMGSLQWVHSVSGRTWQDNLIVDLEKRGLLDWEKILEHRPLITMDERAFGRKLLIYREYLEHPTMDDYWKAIRLGPTDFKKIKLPVLHITGWFDGDQPGAMHYWYGMQNHSSVKDKQYLVVGPWEHVNTFFGGPPFIGDMKFTPESNIDRLALHLAFFDHYLKGSASSFDHPKARLYITGSNQWRDFDDYPPKEASTVNYYLHSQGQANTLGGDGSLSTEKPAKEKTDQFTFDPKNPVPSFIFDPKIPAPTPSDGKITGVDHRPIENRNDVLVYSTPPLKDPVTITGKVVVELYASSDALDTDFTVKLLDVQPDGRAFRLGPVGGIIRARYREGFEQEVLLTPGKVEKYTIRVSHLGHTFLPGHAIRLEVSSSDSPIFTPNQNTGNPVATDVDWNIAHQTIRHDKTYPSALILPVIQ
ncbi:MAG: CocE/NonD family hydrolase [Deltaproteobacteria bacterium]|nr:CocE/NonD family hydrolase [Deltaproteobacteria bacterium]